MRPFYTGFDKLNGPGWRITETPNDWRCKSLSQVAADVYLRTDGHGKFRLAVTCGSSCDESPHRLSGCVSTHSHWHIRGRAERRLSGSCVIEMSSKNKEPRLSLKTGSETQIPARTLLSPKQLVAYTLLQRWRFAAAVHNSVAAWVIRRHGCFDLVKERRVASLPAENY